MKSDNSIFFKILIGVSLAILVFHLSIILKIIPYEVTWGGRLKTDVEMYVFESISIIINLFFVYVLLQKGQFVKSFFTNKFISVTLWVFFVVFSLNTIGNIFAKTTFEKTFTIITLLNAVLIWKINKTKNN
jgi:hypothetical protein